MLELVKRFYKNWLKGEEKLFSDGNRRANVPSLISH